MLTDILHSASCARKDYQFEANFHVIIKRCHKFFIELNDENDEELTQISKKGYYKDLRMPYKETMFHIKIRCSDVPPHDLFIVALRSSKASTLIQCFVHKKGTVRCVRPDYMWCVNHETDTLEFFPDIDTALGEPSEVDQHLCKYAYCIAMCCMGYLKKNVIHIDGKPTRQLPKGRNKKPSIFKTITINNHSRTERPRNDNEEKRNSPRQHSRRGHLRRLKSGKHIWINPAVIGRRENGVIRKDYEITI